MSIYDEESFFEIHITVNVQDIYKFILFCTDSNTSYDFAVGPYLYPDQIDDHSSNSQLMYTKTIKASYGEAIKIANNTKQELEDNGIAVVRVKLEVPANHIFVKKFAQLHPDYGQDLSVGYYEFHFKVALTKLNEQQMIDVTRKHIASFSYNAFSKTKGSVLIAQRVRVPPEDYHKALSLRQQYIDDLIKNGLHVETGTGVHYEFVVYDSNKNLDNGFVPEAIRLT